MKQITKKILTLLLLVVFFNTIGLGQANIPLSGRVTNNSIGTGGVKITAVGYDCPNWQTSIALTNPFGYYSLNVDNTCVFTVKATHKSHPCFEPPIYLFNINELLEPEFEYTDIDFEVTELCDLL